MQSILFVPADRSNLFAKAAAGDASVICLDLEDGVAPSAKDEARENLDSAVSVLASSGKRIAVRINSDLEHISHDIAAIRPDISLIVVPKTGSAKQLQDLDDAIARTHPRSIDLLPLIESAADLVGLEQAGSLPRNVIGLALGTEDFAADLGVSASAEPIHSAFQRLAVLSAQHQISLLGYPGSIAEFKDLELFAGWAQIGKNSGALGGFAIHPAQVTELNKVFALTEAEITTCRDIVDQFSAALEEGRGAISVNGRMVDRPVFLAAKRKLDLVTG